MSGFVEVPQLPAMGENPQLFLEGFYRKVLLPRCAAGLNGFQLLAEERRRRGNKHECCFTVSNRKAPPKPTVSPGKAVTWLLSLALS